jgi:hypothetical protein
LISSHSRVTLLSIPRTQCSLGEADGIWRVEYDGGPGVTGCYHHPGFALGILRAICRLLRLSAGTFISIKGAETHPIRLTGKSVRNSLDNRGISRSSCGPSGTNSDFYRHSCREGPIVMAAKRVKSRSPEPGSFVDLLRRHLRDGTRPDGTPGKLGIQWTREKFAQAAGASIDAVDKWLSGTRRPRNTTQIEKALFGSNLLYEAERRQLRLAHSANQSKLRAASCGKSLQRNGQRHPGGYPQCGIIKIPKSWFESFETCVNTFRSSGWV